MWITRLTHEVHHAVGITKLVVIPSDKLHETRAEHHTGPSIVGAGNGAADEVLRDQGLVGEAQETLHVRVGALLDRSVDLLHSGVLGQLGGEIHYRHIGGGHAERHAGDLALESGDHLAHCLSRTSGRRDDVVRATAATTPVLLGGAVNHHLGGGHGVHCGHESLLNAELVVHGLQKRRKNNSMSDKLFRSKDGNHVRYTLTMGARPLVVQEAQLTKVMSGL